jgi:hypothetical protein
MLTRIAYPIAFIVAVSTIVLGQSIPHEIRGYKVHEAKIKVVNSRNKGPKTDSAEALVTIADPALVDIGLTGVELEFGAEIASTGHSGRVDFLTFRDFRVNGIAVEIEEYDHPFSFVNNQPIKLPQPARVFIGTASIAKAAYRELIESKHEWTVTGTVFVFGKFKKYGFSFKRVVPIRIDIKITNPVKSPA